ncbi:MAG: circadian clock protein KaiA, partial [Waterburya sp.]
IPTKLYICLFSTQQQLSHSVTKLLNRDRYEFRCLSLIEDLTDFVIKNHQRIDCLILLEDFQLSSVVNQLWQSEILLPTIIVQAEQPMDTMSNVAEDYSKFLADKAAKTIYHSAEFRLYFTQLAEINSYINLAITKFISLAPGSKTSQHSPTVKRSLIAQQRRLTEKLKERLSYLGIYYKRNHNSFYRNLSLEEQEKLHYRLSQVYRQILLDYFDNDSQINKLIDEFVDQAFFADISTSQILEIHMELIDDFSYQLKIEGRNDDILLDYRLPLIDVISHLCEMYRRSIPGQDTSLELLFTVE